MSDYTSRRVMMVDTQVRPSDVTKFPIIDAMLTVPRELFVPAARREAAYAGENMVIAAQRVMLEPRSLAKLLDTADVKPGDRVLVVGGGWGYSVAVLARLAGSVVAVESDPGLAEQARAALAQAGAAATVVSGALEAGALAHGPYDVILIEGGVEQVPQAIVDQLAEGGRIGAIFIQGALGKAQVGHKAGGRVTWRFAFNAAAPVLPGFARAAAFAL